MTVLDHEGVELAGAGVELVLKKQHAFLGANSLQSLSASTASRTCASVKGLDSIGRLTEGLRQTGAAITVTNTNGTRRLRQCGGNVVNRPTVQVRVQQCAIKTLFLNDYQRLFRFADRSNRFRSGLLQSGCDTEGH